MEHGALKNTTGLNVVEVDCGAGYLLYNLRSLASHGGKLTCFEADSRQHFGYVKHSQRHAMRRIS